MPQWTPEHGSLLLTADSFGPVELNVRNEKEARDLEASGFVYIDEIAGIESTQSGRQALLKGLFWEV